jgi:hypothetical protein
MIRKDKTKKLNMKLNINTKQKFKMRERCLFNAIVFRFYAFLDGYTFYMYIIKYIIIYIITTYGSFNK